MKIDGQNLLHFCSIYANLLVGLGEFIRQLDDYQEGNMPKLPPSRIYICIGWLIFAICWVSFLSAQKVYAEDNTCVRVSGAGLSDVNGIYVNYGKQNGKPAYKHEKLDYYISYDSFGFGEEWNLTDSSVGGLDLYFFHSSSNLLPDGQWLHGYRGLFPGGQVNLIDCFATGPIITIFEIHAGEQIEGTNGKIGLFSPESFVSGEVIITKLPLASLPHNMNFEPQSKGVQVKISDLDGDVVDSYRGVNYVFFNLNRQTRQLWWQKEISVYHYDGSNWRKVNTFYVRARWPGRVASLVYGPGIYILGTSQ